MANYTYGTLPFGTTTFTVPLTGTDDNISALNPATDFTIDGNGGNDLIKTGSGNDTVTTGAGNDIIKTAGGNNTVSAGDGTNKVITGSGDDVVTTGAGADSVVSGGGDDTLTTGSGRDVIRAGDGNNTITAGAGNDLVRSGNGSDLIDAGSGKDNIVSGGGNDSINAGAGNDRINSQGGIDTLAGGGGHDTFVYAGLHGAMLGADTISDFSKANPANVSEGDVLNLKGLVADFTGTSGLSFEELVASGHLSITGTSEATVISFDSNGSAALGSQGTLVTLEGVAFVSEDASLLVLADNVFTF
jgi:Ca2+-binding RTX toxin-like protein